MNASNRPAVYARPFRTREAAAWLDRAQKECYPVYKKDAKTESSALGILQGKKVGHVWLFSQEAVAKLAGVPIDE